MGGIIMTIKERATEYADRHKNAYLTISSDMKREEQMFQTVEQEHGNISRRESFIALTAMEWADKTMIDKACEWLDRYLHLFVMKGHINHSVLEQEFRKAMEE